MFRTLSRVLTRPFDWSGRARRDEFWTFALLVGVIQAFAWAVIQTNEPGSALVIGAFLFFLAVALLTLLPGLAVTVRRLHDAGRSAWWLLLALVPVVGVLGLLVLLLRRGALGANAYGDDPRA